MNAIEVTGVTKEFLVGGPMAGSLKSLLLFWQRRPKTRIRVLDGLSFTVARGETLAVVGRNGAGKSTLLSLLARIYRPDTGTVRVNGRLAPLLELGAGFHPDLSGRENVVFNAVILGLTRKQVAARMDEIIAFSELGAQIDAPVRTYSSGMTARLGFAVATHVDADVLLVDEVLAVGDFDFERKCYARIDEFRRAGGTILLVSHQAETVRRFADRAIFLQHGKILAEGPPDHVLERYATESESIRR